MPSSNFKYLIALNSFFKFGPKKLKLLKDHFTDWESAFKADLNSLKKAGLKEKIIKEFLEKREEINPELLLEKLEKENIQVISFDCEKYPPLLREIHAPPMIIYYKGDLDIKDEINLAVVGSRKCSYYGQQVINDIIPSLNKYNINIISGLALGIDSLAQAKAVEEGAKTIAVLGSGLYQENIYPKNNRILAEKIINSGGALISEFPPQMPAMKGNFPQRNRIISGISQGTLIVEAHKKSGSFITANFALEQGRDVFAIPGNIYSPTSQGPNTLIKMGAKPVSKAEDILESFNIEIKKIIIEKERDFSEFNETEKLILNHINNAPIHVDKLKTLTKLDTKTINSTLSILEINRIIKNTGGMQYILIN